MGLVNNVKWVSASQFVKVFCQIVGMLFFSRYLTPTQIGIMSMALVVVNFTNVIRDLGTSSFIIQKNVLTESLKKTVFSINLVFGFILMFFFIGASKAISIFFNEPRLFLVIITISITFPINSATSIHLALLERDSQFPKIAKVEVFSSVFAMLIAISLSAFGAGVYSLVSQTILYSLFSSFGFIRFSKWRSHFSFKFSNFHEILPFTSNLVGFNLVNYASRNLDQIIIGRFFSAKVLGEYSLAYRIMLFPVQNITFVLTRSLYPLLSRLTNNHEAALEVYLKSILIIAYVIPPLMIGVSFVSTDFVNVVFGSKWAPVADMIFLLAPIGIMQSMVSTTGSVFMSHGKTKLLLLISLYNAFLQIGSFIVGGFFNVHVLIELYLIANVLMFIPNMYLAFKVLSSNLMVLFRCLLKPAVACSFMCASLFFMKYLILDFSSLQRLVFNILLGGISYVFVICLLERSVVVSFFSRFLK